MSARRLVLTAAAMALIGLTLAALTPAVPEMAGEIAAAQRTVDTAGADTLVSAAAGLLAWLVWAWGAVGLALTAGSAVPGVLGAAARLATHVVLPAGARRSAAVLLGLGLGVTGPLVAGTTVLAQSAAAAVPAAGVPDWPETRSPGAAGGTPTSAPPTADGAVPDWPQIPSAHVPEGSHVVVRGDCLWHIAADRLRATSGTSPSDAEIARAVRSWWMANADVIGPDPDRLLPGQVLRPPDPT